VELLNDIIGGGGSDIFQYGSGEAFTNVNSSSVFETISDFTTNSDKIGVVGVTVSELTYFEGFETVSSGFDDKVVDSGILGFDGTGNDAFLMYNVAGTGVGYLAIDMDGDGSLDSDGDIVLLLSNVDEAADLVFTDFT
jgi:hypothetical protein